MANDLAVRNAGALQLVGFDDVLRLARVLAASGYFKDVRDEAQAAAKIVVGMELGIPPAAALRTVHIFDGQTALHYSLVGALIKSSGKYNYRVIERTAEACEIEFYENGEMVGRIRKTMKEMDARKVSHSYDRQKGEWKRKHTWSAFPDTLLFARTLTDGARAYTPDVFNGPIYTPEELGDIEAAAEPSPAPALAVTVEASAAPVYQCAICEEQVNERAAHAVAKLNGGEVLCKKHWEASDTYRAQQAAKKQKQKGEGVETPLEARFPGGGTLEEPAGELPAEDDDEAAMVEAERAEAVIEADIETGPLCAGCFVAPVEADGDLCTSCAQRDALAKEAKAKRGGRRAA